MKHSQSLSGVNLTRQTLNRRSIRGPLRGHYGRHQRGAAALFVTVILVIIASLSALVVNTAAINEQKLSGVDIRSKEVYAAAVGALEYGATQLENTYILQETSFIWSDDDGDGIFEAGDTTVPLVDFANAAGGATIDQNADTYTQSITYTLLTDESASPAIIDIAATATAAGDTQTTKTISTKYLISNFGTPSLWDGPPLVVEDGLSGVTGTPDLWTSPTGIAIGSINADPVDGGGNCVDPEGDCVDPGAFDVNGGSIDASSGSIGNLGGDGSVSLHEILFGAVTPAQLKAISELEASLGLDSTARTTYYIDGNFSDPSGDTAWNGNSWNDDIGSGTYTMPSGPGEADHAIVLYFDASLGCPPVNGNVTIWGIVFYAAESCDTTIGAQGGGKADVYGTVAFSGSLLKYTANTNIYEVDLAPDGEGFEDIKITTILPGSWKDF